MAWEDQYTGYVPGGGQPNQNLDSWGNPMPTPRQAQGQQQYAPAQQGGGFNLSDFMRAISQNNMAQAYSNQAMMGPQTAYAGTAGQRAGAGATQAVGAMNTQVARERMPYDLEMATRQAGYPAQASVYGSGIGGAASMYGNASRLTGLREILAAMPGLYGSISGAGGGAGGIPNMTTPYGGGYQFT